MLFTLNSEAGVGPKITIFLFSLLDKCFFIIFASFEEYS